MEKSTIFSVLVLLFLHSFQYSRVHSLAATPSKDRDFGYVKFAHDANELPSQGEYDYIVVGGGTAGCPLAATLSSSYKVLVLERGGLPTAFPSLATEGGFVSVLQEEDDGKTTPVDRFVSEEGVASIRGRVLGGTSAINAGIYTRAKKDFYEETGIAWDMDLVNKAYEWVEDAIVYKPVDFPEWQTAQQQGFLEIGVHPDNGFNLAQIKGTRSNALTFDNKGNRHAADELLNKGNPNNLNIALHATVEKIIFSSSESSVTATGIIFSDSNGNTHKAFVRGKGEVILSAGAIGTPQLLLLSGVGPESYLSSLKIPVVRPHPYVAEFFADNPRNYINILPPTEVEPSNVRYLAISDNFYQCSISGPPFTTVPYSLFPSTTSNSSFIHIANKIPGPLSLASFKLGSSSDVRVHPKIKFNYFEDPKDLSNCVSGLKKLGELLRTNALKPFKANKDLPGVEGFNFLGLPLPSDQKDDAGFERHCKDQVASYWHFHGGCLVGKVVDTGLRVLGIDGLRIVDGSAFPVTPASHPAGTVLMFGRYMGLKILQERSEGSQFKSQHPEHSEL